MVCLLFAGLSFQQAAAQTTDDDSTSLAASQPPGFFTDTVLPDLFTGSFHSSIPIQVPPGRAGMAPQLALRYSSSGGDGWVGVGWELEVGAIERSVRSGVDYSGDDYLLRLAGATVELVNIGGEYRAKIEGGVNRIKKIGTHWEVTDKMGKRYLFGQTAASRQDGSPGIFKWCLDQVIDPNGNSMTLSYVKYGGQIYLDRIDYTAPGPTNYVKFYYQIDNNSYYGTYPNYTTNFSVATDSRLMTIAVVANGGLVRAYKLSYTPNGITRRSLLSSVQQFGKDADLDGSGRVTGGTALPAMTFTYQTGGSSWSTSVKAGPAPATPVVSSCLTGDINGDGKSDFWCETASGSGSWKVATSTGSGWTTATWSGPGPATPLSSNCMVGDLNGDGKSDFWCETASRSGSWTVATSTGSGWTTVTRSGPVAFTPLSSFCMVGDLNGDGQNDFWCETASGSGSWTVAISTATGSGWTTATWSGLNVPASLKYSCLMGDLNGDGKTDFWCETGSGTGVWNVALSTGNGWTAATWSGLKENTPLTSGSNCMVGDLNGDGKSDFLCTGDSNWSWLIALSTGNGWITTPQTGPPVVGLPSGSCIGGDLNGDGKNDFWCWDSPTGGGWLVTLFSVHGWFGGSQAGPAATAPVGSSCLVGDLDGNGTSDFWCETGNGTGSWSVALTVGPAPDLLTSISNGLGGTTTITYTPSTQYTNTQLPFPVQTVSSITANDGNGVISTTNYAYSGGFYYPPERDFRGFSYAKVTGPSGPNGERRVTETWFHQGNDTAVNVNTPDVPVGYMQGKPYSVQVTDGSGHVYSLTTTSYADDADDAAPYFTPPLEVDSYTYDGDSSYKQTRVISSYESTYGNLTRVDQYGDVADSTDDRTTTRSYSPNTTDWIIGLPASETVYQGIGTTNQIAHTDFYYDGVTSCAVASNNQTPTQGNLTRIVRWLPGGASPESRMAYDAYGNLVCTQDANGHQTTITYDSSSTFPEVVKKPLIPPTTTQYYGVNGVPSDFGLYGQVKSVTDPNGNVTTTTYDALGRKATITFPLSSAGFLYNNFGAVGTQHVRTDTSAGLSSWSYFDGLGRTIIGKKSGPDAKVLATKTQYNNTGTVAQTSLPYFDGLETPKWRKFTYDPMGRVLQVTNPDNTRTLGCYNDWVTVSIDADNHRKRETRNAAGHPIKVEEYKNTYTTCATTVGSPYATTTYQYDLLGNPRFVTDAKGNQTEMRYDTLGRKIFMHDPDMGYWTYAYDGVGNMTRQTDGNGQVFVLTYDDLNRIKTKSKTGQDTAPPSTPTNLVVTAVSESQLDLTWTASTDDVGVAEYMIERCQGTGCSNFLQIASASGTTYSDTGLSLGVNYRYRLRAIDLASNPSAYSNIASATTPDTTPPTAPSNLTATAVSSTQINLAWTASTDNVGVTGYRVERCTGAGCGNYSQIATPPTNSFNNTSLNDGTSYRYRVRAVDAAGNPSAYSNIASATTPDTTPPTAPSNLTATAVSSTQINLAWTASSDNVGVTGYRVERCTGAGCSTYSQIATSTTTSYYNTGLSLATSYSYRVRAVDAAGHLSTYSNIATVMTLDTTPPTAPSSLTATTVSTIQINLSWVAATDTGGSGLADYRVERCSGSTTCSNFNEIATVTSPTVTYINTGLTAGTIYRYRVRARDGANNYSGYSAIATATTKSGPVVTSLTPASVTYGITASRSIAITGSNFVLGAMITVQGPGGTISGVASTTGTAATVSAPFVYTSVTSLKFWWATTAMPPGSYTVIVTNPASSGGLSATKSAGFVVTAPVPTIGTLSPASAVYGITASKSISIPGTNFVQGATITLTRQGGGGSLTGVASVTLTAATAANPFVYSSATYLRFWWATTALPPGSYTVIVTNPASSGGLSATKSAGFVVTAPVPTIGTLSPASAVYGITASKSISIPGTNFVQGATITLTRQGGGGSLTGVASVTLTAATAANPFVYSLATYLRFWWANTALPAGTYNVTVTNPASAGSQSVTKTGGFVVTAPKPTISSVSLASVTYGVTASRSIAITGSNFVLGATITLQGPTTLTGVASVTASAATVTSPFVLSSASGLRFWWDNTALPAGSYNVTVTNPAAAGGLGATKTSGFVVN
jgi:YD repeat-containing protein